jgi:hypothetical protein
MPEEANASRPAPRPVLMKAGHARPQHPELHTDPPDRTMSIIKGILHFWPFAKNAAAFPGMPHPAISWSGANPVQESGCIV